MKTWKYGNIYSVSLKVVLAGVAIHEAGRTTEVGTQPILAAEYRIKGEETNQKDACILYMRDGNSDEVRR